MLQSCPTLCDPIDGSPPGSPVRGILQNTGVGCHFLLQCMKVKSESEVAQSCPTLRDPVDCSLPGSSIHGIFQARVLEWGAIAYSIYTLVYIKQINNKDLLYSTGSYTQYSVIIYKGKEPEKERMYVYVWPVHFAVHQKLKQHCKSTILQ